jgi:hypothetical protein
MNTVFRPKGNLVWAGLAFALDALFIIQTIFYPGESGVRVLDLLIAATLAAVAYLLWVRPKLVLREGDLIVVNPIKTSVINYSDITDLKTKWTLQIDYRDTSVQVWVAPANGKGRWIADSTFRWKNDRVPVTERKTLEHTSMSQSLRSDSGIAASLIRERMKH